MVEVTSMFEAGKLGGILKAPPAFGKTVTACAIIARMNVPTLVVVHKEFLIGQETNPGRVYILEATGDDHTRALLQ